MSTLYLGLISGTSADGIDAALLDTADGNLRVSETLFVPYPDSLRAQVAALARDLAVQVDSLGQIDAVLGESFANAALALLDRAGLTPADVAAIGSHGQTVRHRPTGSPPFTLQIGDPNQIAARTGITTVADFRRRDMALGGQGAPLAPAFHAAAFGSESEIRAVVNLGGIANITILRGHEVNIGFDTGPANCLLDQHAAAVRGEAFDRDGLWARQGSVSAPLLEQLLSDAYFSLAPPKSSGPEYFNLDWVAAHQQTAGATVSGADLQATLAELTASSVAAALREHAPEARLVLLCGGGVHNPLLLERLSVQLPGAQLNSTSLVGVDADFVEAAAFAWLAQQTIEGQPGNVPAVTGASGPCTLGAIYPA